MRVKVKNFVVRHNKIEYGEHDVFELGQKEGERLIGTGCVVETIEAVTSKETPDQAGEHPPVDMDALLQETEDFMSLKVDVLKRICAHLGLPVSGNKADLAASIESKMTVEEPLDLDEMDEAALLALAKEEDVALDDAASVEEMRDILEEALS